MNAIKSFLDSIMLLDLFAGLGITGRHLFKKKMSIQYPEDRIEPAANARSTARRTRGRLTPSGHSTSAGRSPIGHCCKSAALREVSISIGVKWISLSPSGASKPKRTRPSNADHRHLACEPTLCMICG